MSRKLRRSAERYHNPTTHVTLPLSVLKDAGLAAGDEVVIRAVGRGRVEVERAETIVRPLQEGTDATMDEFFDAAGISIVAIDRAVARRAAALRAEHQSLRLPDATSLATGSALVTLHKKLRQVARRVQRL